MRPDEVKIYGFCNKDRMDKSMDSILLTHTYSGMSPHSWKIDAGYDPHFFSKSPCRMYITMQLPPFL